MEEIKLSRAYKNGLSSSLSIVEELLIEIEDLLNCENKNAVFIKWRNSLNASQKEGIKKEIGEIREQIEDIKTKLLLPSEILNNSVLISSRCGKMWEILCDLETRKLKRYGEIPKNLSDFLDPKIRKVVNSIEKILEIK